MRAIGAIQDAELAKRFTDYLFARKITSEIRPNSDGEFVVWIHRDDQIAPAREELQTFLQNPRAETYLKAHQLADEVRQEEERKDREFRKNVRQITHGSPLIPRRSTLVVSVMIAATIVVALVTLMSPEAPIRSWLFINATPQSGAMARENVLPSVRSGEIWRLWTPALLHFTPFHLLFNLFGLYNLGIAIESRLKPTRMILFVLVLGVLPNLAQYFWTGSQFGGMSGIVCGLFGYVWMKSTYEPSAMMHLDSRSVVFFIAFLVIAAMGGFGPIANFAHFAGLGLGMAVGAYHPLFRKL